MSGRVVAASVDPAVELVEFAELKLAYAAQAVRIAEYESKVKLKSLDSGANISVICDVTHVDTNTVPLCCRAEDAAGVVTASGEELEISGRGSPYICCLSR